MGTCVKHGEPRPDRDLDPVLRELLHRLAQIASRRGTAIWLVGGVVRDLLLGIVPERDIDLALDGDVAGFAHDCDGTIQALHQAFGTATLHVAHPDAGAPFVVDLVRTRREHYRQPAALPEVEPADIFADLFRRDFSINAMALPLELDRQGRFRFGALLDPYGGQADLAAGRLRILHPASFEDDPTRILRGLRLAARLQLQADAGTLAALHSALAHGHLTAAGPDRLRSEICLALAEAQPAEVLRLADAWQVTAHLVHGLHWSPQLAASCQLAAASATADALVYAGILCYDVSEAERATIRSFYRLPSDADRVLGELAPLRASLQQLSPQAAPSQIDQQLRPFHVKSLRAAAFAGDPQQRRMIETYLDHLRDVRPLLDGHALQELGVPPGPEIGYLLRHLRAARLDGLVHSRADEEQLVQRLRAADQ